MKEKLVIKNEKSKEESGFMSRLAKKSKDYMIVFGMLGMLGGMVQKAEARPNNVRESKKIEFIVAEAKKTPNKVIEFLEAKPEIDKVEGREAKFSSSAIVVDKIEPNAVKSGEKNIYEIKMLFVKSEFLSGADKDADWHCRMETAGYEDQNKNPLGRAEDQISPLKYGDNYSLITEDIRAQEQTIWDEAQIVEAFKEIGKENSPEAQEAKKILERDLSNFHKDYSGLKINESAINDLVK
jgi:hypothetical protein